MACATCADLERDFEVFGERTTSRPFPKRIIESVRSWRPVRTLSWSLPRALWTSTNSYVAMPPPDLPLIP